MADDRSSVENIRNIRIDEPTRETIITEDYIKRNGKVSEHDCNGRFRERLDDEISGALERAREAASRGEYYSVRFAYNVSGVNL